MTPKTATKYFEAVGRRKTAVARVRLFPAAKSSYLVNEKALESYFPVREMRSAVTEAVNNAKSAQSFDVMVKVSGSGLASQAEAIRLGIARALIVHDPELRGKIKKFGYLKRDPRAKERRKFGLKKARKSPQWSKR